MTQKLDLSWMDAPPVQAEPAPLQAPPVLPKALRCGVCGDAAIPCWGYGGINHCEMCAPLWLRSPTEENLPGGRP